MILNLSEVLWA